MPITRKEFYGGVEAEKVGTEFSKFLSRNSEKAFTVEEIAKEVGYPEDLTRYILVCLTDDVRTVEERIYKGVPYYAINLDAVRDTKNRK